MHKGLEFSPLPLEVENPFGNNSLKDILDNCEEGPSPFEESPLSDTSSQQPTCYEPWEDFQSLSPFGADWEMEQEFFKSDFSDLDCKSQGPTLAELNNQRSMSPLINPEMERLHRIATRTEAEPTSSRTGSHLLLKFNADERELNMENQRSVANNKNDGKIFLADISRSLGEENKGLKSSRELENVTRMVTSSTCTEHKDDTIELKKEPEIIKRIALMEPKSIGQTIVDNSRNIQRNYSDFSTSLRDVCASELSRSSRNLPVEEELPVIKEESADEDMDSDEDYEEPRGTNDDGESPIKQRKGRRGDVEDLSPNPRRLLEIGRELNRLTKIITELKPIHSLPMSARNKSKKEKNKLASRACRLKKKAQHESNKLKLHGLELEQQRLVSLIDKVKREILRDTEGYTVSGDLSNKVENMIHTSVGEQVVAGHLTAFVESVLKATANATPGFQGVDVQLNI